MPDENLDLCIFCKNRGPFNTKEHIVPESLGNDTDILANAVCDKCQRYLGTSIEQPALDKTPFAFWRTYLGIKTKQGKCPSIDLTPPEGGRIPAVHPLTDHVGFAAHEDGSTSLDIEDPGLIRNLLSAHTRHFKLVLSPWHLIIMGRFLGKIGLEFIALQDKCLALSPDFEQIRHYVRRGTTSYIWPVFWGSQGDIKDLKGPLVDKGSYYEQEIDCYRWALGESVRGEYIFAFAMGTDLAVICLSHRNPDPWLSNVIEGVKLDCLHYSDRTW